MGNDTASPDGSLSRAHGGEVTRRGRARQKWLTFGAVLGLAYWFFGNLYEAVVIAPNWLVDTPAQLRRMHELFVVTTPTQYFVPVTWVATLLVWILTAFNTEPELARDYRRASLVAVLAMALNVFIVATIIVKLFGDDYLAHGDVLRGYALRWNVLNTFRMALVGAAAAFTFNAFRKLDRL